MNPCLWRYIVGELKGQRFPVHGTARYSWDLARHANLVAQSVRTAGSWAMAWAGAKAGVAIGAAAGVESGPGLVLTAIGGGLIFGIAGDLGADWIAGSIYED